MYRQAKNSRINQDGQDLRSLRWVRIERLEDAERSALEASEGVKPGRSGLFTAEAWRYKQALRRAGRPSLDRRTYLTVAPAGCSDASCDVYAQVRLYPDSCEVEYPSGQGVPVGGGARGRIQGKSAAARRRQMRLLARVRPEGRLYFFTLTYSDDWVRVWQGWKRDLDTFLKRLFRKWPEAGVLWGMELERRKSGDFIGTLAPHFHMIVFGVSASDLDAGMRDRYLTSKDNGKGLEELILQGWVKENWYQTNHVEDPANRRRGADVRELDSRRKVYNYVSKYTAKVDNGVLSGETVFTGRMWGVRGNVPLHPGIVLPVVESGLKEFKRLVKRWLKARGRKIAASGGNGRKSIDYGKRIAEWERGRAFVVFGLGLDVMGATDSQAVEVWAKLLSYCIENGGGYYASAS